VNRFSSRLSVAGLAVALMFATAPAALAEGADASQAQAGGAITTPSGRVLVPDAERHQRASRFSERFGNRFDRSERIAVERDIQRSRNFDRGRDFDRRSDFDRGFYRRGSYAYYNGHRGYRYRRDGYREHNGWFFPLAAFAAGALIAGAAAPPPVVAANPHVDWCARTYRSYNPYDNTFQPFNGPRRYCVSPYS
jgi:hypothetical protein